MHRVCGRSGRGAEQEGSAVTDQERGEGAVLTTKRKRIMTYFVEATRNLIQTDGVDGLSIRKIANAAGYNSATIYNYFRDLEHLSLFGSACYLRDYVLALSRSLTPEMNALERYRCIYRCFNDIAFQNPDVFHNMFFGRYSEQLGDVLRTYYYELFPEELSGLSEPLREMLVAGSMTERDSVTIQAMVEEGFLAPEKAQITMELIIAVHQSFIYEASINAELDLEEHKARFNRMFDYLLEQGR